MLLPMPIEQQAVRLDYAPTVKSCCMMRAARNSMSSSLKPLIGSLVIKRMSPTSISTCPLLA